MLKHCLTAITALLLGGCVSLPEGIEPVQNFDLQRYLGTWYEIARLDHSFERGLEQVTAEYSLREDGGVQVVNRGYKTETGVWKEVTGRAYFVEDRNVGRLKVSFFGPFYGGYNIIALDQADYQWAMICGPTREYLWILARQPQLKEDILAELLRQAQAANFSLDTLIRVVHKKD